MYLSIFSSFRIFIEKCSMATKFIHKRVSHVKPQKAIDVRNENKEVKQDTNMDISEKIAKVEDVINDTPKAVKKIKKDKGLIERTESSKTIITEDNKQVLFD